MEWNLCSRRRRLLVAAGLVSAVAGLAPTVSAQNVDFSGKRIEITVPFSPGGGSDVYVRAMAPHLERHLPGKPSIIVRNLPGAGGVTGSNQFQARSKPDGTHVISTSSGTFLSYVFRREKTQYALEKWQPILISPQGAVIYVAASTGIQSSADIAKLKGRQLVFGGDTPTAGEMRIIVAMELMGLDVKHVWGVTRGPARLAFERGEFTINYDTTPGWLRNGVPLMKAGKAVPLFSFGIADEKGNIVRDPNLPDIPTFNEVYASMHGKPPAGPGYEAYKALFQIGIMLNKGLFLPADTPKNVVETWRAAVKRMLDDPEFEKHASAIVEGYPQTIGENAWPLVREAITVSPQAWDWIRNYLKTRHNVTL
jgi:tripartite-type tricarboxylate transporter receptor subunit TctC